MGGHRLNAQALSIGRVGRIKSGAMELDVFHAHGMGQPSRTLSVQAGRQLAPGTFERLQQLLSRLRTSAQAFKLAQSPLPSVDNAEHCIFMSAVAISSSAIKIKSGGD